ncbi:MAG: small multi-drug export protein [Candidatus Thermoplasmatota archaeon]|nr:small multi-drug export protein [Candidatus Thermoplasmatota archaeon]
MSIAEPLMEALGGLPLWGKWLSTVLIAMLPVVELRGALPAAINIFKLPWGVAIVLSIIGNMLPIPFLMLFFGRVEKFLRRWRPFDLFFDGLFRRTRIKGERKLQVWGDIGLIFFVAVPFPITGAWTGTLVAILLKLDKVRSFLAIFIGVVIAGFIMTLVSFIHWIWAIPIMGGLFVLLIIIWKLENIILSRITSDRPSH